MFKKIFSVCFILLCSQFAFAESYPPEMLKTFSKEYLDLYFSLPKEQQTDSAVNNWGNYDSENISCFNSVYKPDTVITPFRPKWQEKEAEYYFNEGLKMPKPKSIY